MIVVAYEEKIEDASTGVTAYIPLGSESHWNIEEVLLPCDPLPNRPVFFTKKFVGHDEHRWQVRGVSLREGVGPTIYVVTLVRRPQVDKQYYLKKIAFARGEKIRKFLHPWALVEVEFGHAPGVGKANGCIKDNKRYVDTVQLHSMPKRRLAIVVQVIERSGEDLVQVIPISSRQPDATDKAAVDVTSELSTMAHYRKSSWAACRMIQTVTASRIIAPMIQRKPGVEFRDKGFRFLVRGQVRDALKDALMFGVAAGGRVVDTANLQTEKRQAAQAAAQIIDLQGKVELYERFLAEAGWALGDVAELVTAPPAS